MFEERVREAAIKAVTDPGWKIEVAGQAFRITYTFPLEGRFYTHENATTFRAVTHAMHNPLIMAMNDLTDSVDKFKLENHV